jgi:hypothetical protein
MQDWSTPSSIVLSPILSLQVAHLVSSTVCMHACMHAYKLTESKGTTRMHMAWQLNIHLDLPLELKWSYTVFGFIHRNLASELKVVTVTSFDNFATVPKAHAPRVNTCIPYIVRDTQRSIYTSSHAIASWEKSRSLESANDAISGKQSVLEKSIQIMCLERDIKAKVGLYHREHAGRGWEILIFTELHRRTIIAHSWC